MTFGIPYARQEIEGDHLVAVCPKCDARIALREAKDFESFTGDEYARHYAAQHDAGCPNCGDRSDRPCARCARFGAHGGACAHG